MNIDACRIGDQSKGRWPANLLLDERAAQQLDAQTGTLTSGKMKAGQQRKASKRQGRLPRRYAGYGHGSPTPSATLAGPHVSSIAPRHRRRKEGRATTIRPSSRWT